MPEQLTPKQRVLRKHPAAFSYTWKDGTVCILRPFLGGNLNLSSEKGAVKAWAQAWENIRTGKA